MLYSKQTGGFYSEEVHSNIPADAVQISDDLYHALLIGQEEGKHIVAGDNDVPVLVDAIEPSLEVKKAQRIGVLMQTLKEIDSAKIRAMTDFILTNDKTRLTELEAHAEVIRVELRGIGA